MDTLFLNRTLQLQTKLLNKEYIGKIIQLREKVLSKLTHADYYIPEQNEYEFIAHHCGITGDAFGVFFKKRLVAYAFLSYHNLFEKENLGATIGLPPTLYNHISQLASCMVLPAFQGLGLHKILIRQRINLAHAQGYSHCLALVSPQNIPSRHNLLQQGFQIHWVGTLPGLSVQHIFYYNTLQPMQRLATNLAQQVEMTDINRQKQLLQQGYYGYTDKTDTHILLFAPLFS